VLEWKRIRLAIGAAKAVRTKPRNPLTLSETLSGSGRGTYVWRFSFGRLKLFLIEVVSVVVLVLWLFELVRKEVEALFR